MNMRKNVKRASAALLIMLVASSILTSCGSSGSGTASETTAQTGSQPEQTVETEAEKTDYFAGLPDKDYEGYNFRMLIRNMERWIVDMYADSENGDVVNDAVYKRNAQVSEKYDMVFSMTKSSSDNYETDAVNTILAGDDAYDLVLPHPRAAFVYANQGLFADWNTMLPYVDLEADYWDQDARENLSINHKLYVMTGDISHASMGAADVMLFNKRLLESYNLEAPYQLVLDGKWTYDKFEEMVLAAKEDVNGDGVMDKDTDLYGYVTQKWIGPIEALYTAGERVLTKDADDMPVISIYNENTINVFNWYFGLVDSENCYLQTEGNSWDSGFISIFMSGRALFIDINMDDVITMREMDDDFGIIPWPKPSESADYCTNVDACENMFGVPITTSDYERTSIILESLARIGNAEVIPAYYEIALQTKFTRDAESVQMLDIIKQARVYDLGYYNNELTGELGNQFSYFAGKTERDFASWYNKYAPKAEAQIAKIVEFYKN